ncbi:GntR family transcriptional regulator [Paenisporosarcina quisquiliarum]|uniref:GntR family transcriptional regulator n=1 Tax=Paenisporosarcina quisquiliarum TaxID=365346 RepID=A0A9X3LHP2_9BACL|nr:GntR family transcriptional regulator [Paenisporosarcina quisquiliarum]MCZ8537550.1 GntR family transcriptional regulator [Paenisporosarcina quisquiliarum]
MFIEIEPDSTVPIYLQLAQQIIEGVAKGTLKPGDSLPSVRSFAADLGMNMHTVNKAYHYLEEKEFIQIVQKKGVVIHEKGVRKATATDRQRLTKEMRPILAEALCLQLSQEDIELLVKEIILDLKEVK